MPPPDRSTWAATTHAWRADVDAAHLDVVRSAPASYAPGGLLHLVLEVMAYADDEAQACGRRGKARVTVHGNGSVSVEDDGRGTDTRRDDSGAVVRKPVMATRDLRFFDADPPILLPDGHPRRGISVVAALSRWLVHLNRRSDGSWSQRYEHGLPTTALVPVDRVPLGGVPGTGTTVHFSADPTLVGASALTPGDAPVLAAFGWLDVRIDVEQAVTTAEGAP